jgi:phosphoadenosine phosphosulfate reductase
MSAITLYARKPSDTFADKVSASIALLQESAKAYVPITQASSLGAEDMVVTDLIARAGIKASIFVLDTGKLHQETLDLIGRLEAHYDRKVDVYCPDTQVAEHFVAENGEDAMYRSLALRKTCCDFRKMEPLARALAGHRGWITGLRREQSNARAAVDSVELQEIAGATGQDSVRAKVNPLADWTWGDVWHYIAERGVPYNPLHDRFFPSIGCAPCTRAVTLGEDFRSGRWWWEAESAKECGLHVAADGTAEAEEPAPFEALGSRLHSQAGPTAAVPQSPSTVLDRPASHQNRETTA